MTERLSRFKASQILAIAAYIGAAWAVMPVQAAESAPVPDASACRPLNPPSDSGPFSWPVMIFFDSHDATLTTSGKRHLDAFAHLVISLHANGIVLEASKDTAERTSADRDLDARRAKAVTRYLANAGVHDTPAITLAGNKNLLVPTAPGVAEAQNRFVLLRVSGSYDDWTHREHRILLCRRWTLANCIGPASSAPPDQCKAAIGFLVRGDDVQRDLDLRTDFVQ